MITWNDENHEFYYYAYIYNEPDGEKYYTEYCTGTYSTGTYSTPCKTATTDDRGNYYLDQKKAIEGVTKVAKVRGSKSQKIPYPIEGESLSKKYNEKNPAEVREASKTPYSEACTDGIVIVSYRCQVCNYMILYFYRYEM